MPACLILVIPFLPFCIIKNDGHVICEENKVWKSVEPMRMIEVISAGIEMAGFSDSHLKPKNFHRHLHHGSHHPQHWPALSFTATGFPSFWFKQDF